MKGSPNKLLKRRLQKLKYIGYYRPKLVNKLEDPDPMETDDTEALLIVVDGSNGRVIRAEKDGDDQALTYEENGKPMECKITSKPLNVEETEMYFTKDGYLGTMALNKDTLLDADIYDEADEIDGEAGYTGDIESLVGSKATLRKSNEAKRLRQLLTPQKMDRQKLLLTLGAGAGIGFVVAQYMMG